MGLTISARHAPPLPGDLVLIRTIQSLDTVPAVDAVLRAVDWVNSGFAAVLLVGAIGVAIAWAGSWRLLSLFAAANTLRIMSALLKEVTGRARPTEALVHILQHPSDFSFPSGHALGAVLCYGTLAIAAETTNLPRSARRSIQATCLGVIVLQGIARVYFGVHWPSDVLGGYLWGIVLLIPLIRLAQSNGLVRFPSKRARA